MVRSNIGVGYLLRLLYILHFPLTQEKEEGDDFDEVAEADIGHGGKRARKKKANAKRKAKNIWLEK